MDVTIAYIEEPPFGWTDDAQGITGADIELAETVLKSIGVARIAYRRTTFDALLPGVQSGRWDMNVPLFVTRERASQVAFSVPVWAIGDAFLVRAGNPKGLDSYRAVAARDDARLGIIAGQVQHRSAQVAGVRDDQLVVFQEQAEAVDALCTGAIDAYASTAVGNRILAARIGTAPLEAVEHGPAQVEGLHAPLGAFSFNKHNDRLLDAVNERLRSYLGSADHLARMAKYGITEREIGPAIAASR